jgi:hypothetical protein
MHRRAGSHFHGLQIETSRFAAAGEDHAQQLTYFAGDFLLDRFGRFFSCAESVLTWAGRIWQIRALTSMKALCKLCNFRNAAISLCALRMASASDRDLVTLLPFTL